MNSTETLVNVVKDCNVEETSDTALSLLDFRLHKDNEGLWIQCDACDAWRHVLSARDPLLYANVQFFCSEVKKHCGSPSDKGVDGLFYHPEFFPGNVVWAQKDKDSVGSGPHWWPALIEDGHDRRSQFFLLGANKSPESRPIAYHVTFLDTWRSGGWVGAHRVHPFIDDAVELVNFQKQKSVAAVPKRARLLTEAIERARNALRTKDITNRLELFSFVAHVARQRGMLKMSDKADYIANGTTTAISSSERTENGSRPRKKIQFVTKKRSRQTTSKGIRLPKRLKKAVDFKGLKNQEETPSPSSEIRSQKESFIPRLIKAPATGRRKRLGNLNVRNTRRQHSAPTQGHLCADIKEVSNIVNAEFACPVQECSCQTNEEIPEAAATNPQKLLDFERIILEKPSQTQQMVPAQNVAALPQIQKETVNLPEKRNEKSQFAPPLRQPPREAIEKSHEVTPKTLQNTSIQAAASGSRVPDIPLTLETDLPPQKIVLALQRQQQIPRTPEDHSVNPSPYTIDWLEAKYSHLLTDSDCDSGIMDVSERGEESNPSGQIRQSQSYMNSQPISYDSIDQNSLKETVIRIPARPKPSFSAPVRKPYKPLSQEVLGSQGTSQVNAHSHPNSQNSWSSQLSHESYSQPQDW